MAEPWVSVGHIAAHLGVRKDSVYRWIEHRGLPAQKIGKLWKLKVSEVEAWVRAEGARDTDEPRALPEPVSQGAVSGDSIMIIDDDETVRATLRDFLADEGYGSILAADGEEALGLLRSDRPRPALIILDLGMPNMDGWQFREQQERDPMLAAIPVIVVTADRCATIARAGAVLRKPVNLGHLARAIDKLLSGGH